MLLIFAALYIRGCKTTRRLYTVYIQVDTYCSTHKAHSSVYTLSYNRKIVMDGLAYTLGVHFAAFTNRRLLYMLLLLQLLTLSVQVSHVFVCMYMQPRGDCLLLSRNLYSLSLYTWTLFAAFPNMPWVKFYLLLDRLK